MPYVEGEGKGPVEKDRKVMGVKGAESTGGQVIFGDARAAPAGFTFVRDTLVGRIVPRALW